jgi:HEPN domain-containing protein
MKDKVILDDWFKRAKSNLLRAKSDRNSEEILYEDLCLDCQQAIEKSLKGLLFSIDVDFPWTHSIARLFELLKEAGIIVPDEFDGAVDLTVYAQGTRYPGIQESVTEEEYKEALSLAEVIYFWARENAYRQ